MIEGLCECSHSVRLIELLSLLHSLLLLEGYITVHGPTGEKFILLPLLRPCLLRIVVGVSLNVALLNESHGLSFHGPLILILSLHLLSKDVSVDIVCGKSLLLEAGIPIIEVPHEVGVIVINKVATRARVEIMWILCTTS
jgi:hypothetical protein